MKLDDLHPKVKDIPGYEGLYSTTNDGRIWSYITKKYLAPLKNHKGYTKACLNGKRFFIHRLVAITFIPNPENKREVNHINGIKNDNRVENLEWVTGSENVIHAFKNGKFEKQRKAAPANGKRSRKLTDCQVKQIKEMYESGYSQRMIAKMFDVCQQTISLIMTNKTYREAI